MQLSKSRNFTEDKQTINIEDLRPSLGLINWQLRRLGINLQITVDKGKVLSAAICEGIFWTCKCEMCGTEFQPGRERDPECPQCDLQDERS